MTLPSPNDDLVDQLVTFNADQEGWRLPPKPSTSVTIEPPLLDPHHNELELIDNAVPGTAKQVLLTVEELKAVIAESVRPKRWLSGWKMAGDDFQLPDYTRFVMFVVPTSVTGTTPVYVGTILHQLPAGPATVVIPTLKAPKIGWVGTPDASITFQAGSDPDDALMLRSVAV